MRSLHRLMAMSLMGAAAPIMAQTSAPAQPVRVVPEPPRGIAGDVVSVGADTVVLRHKDGALVTVAMNKGWTVSRPRKGTAAEIRVGDFVASANRDAGPDRGIANELRVLEPGYQPEYGTHSLAAAGVSMTHGFVFGTAPANGGTEVTVAYPEGRRTILIPAGMPVVVSELLPRTAAGPGVAVTGVTRPGADGIRRAARLTLPE